MVLNWGDFAPSGNIWQYMEMFFFTIFFFFLMWTILNVFIEFVAILPLFLLLLLFCFLAEACRILASQPGIEPVPSALEGKVLTTGSPGKSPWRCSWLSHPGRGGTSGI